MWSLRSVITLLCLSVTCPLLAGCGFHPVYGNAATQAGHATAMQGNVLIAPIRQDRFGQVLKAALEDRFNPQGLVSAAPDYTLTVTLNRIVTPSVVRNDGTILRYEVRFVTHYTLTDNTQKSKPLKGDIRRISSYNVVPNGNFATYEAEQDLNERMLREIAEDYVLRVTGHLAGAS